MSTKGLLLRLATLLIVLGFSAPAWANISFFGAGAIQGTTTTTDAQAAPPASTLADDIAIVSCFTRSTTETTTVSGYTQLAQKDTSTGSHTWFYLRATGALATATCDSDTSADHSAIMYVFRGALASGNPFAVTGTPEEDSPAATFTVAAVTTTNIYQMVIVLSDYEDDDLASFAVTGTDPSAYTETYTEVTTSTSDSALSVAYEIRTAAGSSGTITLDYSGDGTDQFATLALVLRNVAPESVVEVQHKLQFSSSGNTAAVTVTALGASNLLIVGVGTDGGGDITGITSGACNVTWTKRGSTYTNSTKQVETWECTSAVAGTTTVTCTFTNSGASSKICNVYEVAGFTTPIYDTSNGDSQNGTNPTGASVTTTSTSGFIVGILYGSNCTANPASGNEFTFGGNTSGSVFCGVSFISTTAAAHNPAWTAGSNTWAEITAAWKETPVATGKAPPLMIF